MPKKVRNVVTLSGGALVAASPFIATGTAHAATITVDSLADDGSGGTTLREAIEQANSNADADVIQFSPTLTGTITLTESLNLYTSMSIEGPGAAVLTIDADDTDMVFYTRDAEGLAEISISGLTLTGGFNLSLAGAVSSLGDNVTLEDLVITGSTGKAAGGVYFAGDYDDEGGTMTIRNCDISGNTGNSWAGGIYLYNGGDADTPSMVIENTTISGNNAVTGWGGGLYVGEPVGEVHISNSTISGNSVAEGGGGGGIYISKDAVGTEVHIVSSTITGNSGDFGGGLYVGDSSVSDVVIENSVIAGNTANGSMVSDATAGSDIWSSTADPIAIDYSFIGSTVGYTSAGGHNLSGDPMLGALADNGGIGETHLPQAGSPVIDAGDPAYSTPPSTDQRGLARVVNTRIDMGAVEVQAATLPPTGGSNGLMATLGAGLLALGGALHLTGRRKRTA